MVEDQGRTTLHMRQQFSVHSLSIYVEVDVASKVVSLASASSSDRIAMILWTKYSPISFASILASVCGGRALSSWRFKRRTISSDLKWSAQIDSITTKAAKRLYLLRQLKGVGIAPSHLVLFYQVFHCNLPLHLSDEIKHIQRHALRIIFSACNYSERLVKAGLPSLYDRRSQLCNCHVISQCAKCRKLRGVPQVRKMVNMRVDHVEPSPPFSYCAVDFFGPFLNKEKESWSKALLFIFTCLASTSVHLETANSLNTSPSMHWVDSSTSMVQSDNLVVNKTNWEQPLLN